LAGAYEDTVFARISLLADTIFARISLHVYSSVVPRSGMGG